MAASALDARGPAFHRTYSEHWRSARRSTLTRPFHLAVFAFVVLIFIVSVNVAVAGEVFTASEDIGTAGNGGNSEIEQPVMLDETFRSLTLLQAGNAPLANHVMLDETLRSLTLQAIGASSNTSARIEPVVDVMICVSCTAGFLA